MENMSLDNFGKAESLKDSVYKVLRSEILMGHFAYGEKLSISSIANRAGISLAPVREAMSMLSKDGLVELIPNKQPVVSDGSYWDFCTTATLRSMLEPYAARISTPLIPQSEIDKMRDMLDSVAEVPENLEAFIESDLAMHEMLHKFANSRILSETLEKLKSYNMKYRYVNDKGENTEHLTSTQEHLEIVNAIDRRDPDLAYAAVYRHLEAYRARNDAVVRRCFAEK